MVHNITPITFDKLDCHKTVLNIVIFLSSEQISLQNKITWRCVSRMNQIPEYITKSSHQQESVNLDRINYHGHEVTDQSAFCECRGKPLSVALVMNSKYCVVHQYCVYNEFCHTKFPSYGVTLDFTF